MKTFKAILRIFIILLLLISCKDETDDSELSDVFSGDVTLLNQQEVETFGANNYTTITGSLTLDLDLNTNDLSPLLSLNTIGGDLNIFDCEGLTHVDGLSNISTVGECLMILNNTNLTNLEGLSGLTSVGGFLNIMSNSTLINLNGLSSLTSVGGDLMIAYNDVLTNLNELNNLTSVGGDLVIASNNALTNFCGLTYLITSNGWSGSYIVNDNAFNPTQQDIIDGNCSQ